MVSMELPFPSAIVVSLARPFSSLLYNYIQHTYTCTSETWKEGSKKKDCLFSKDLTACGFGVGLLERR